ncbi:hypothetical protein [Wolbachia endosymbiont (group A) of Clivina fossor]|uniref:hypothetical protein n=1 Tax=Wolbachia endosymbiont (group A) of Clivina fossor TaxID=3066133 RepID=UPI0031333386
MGRQIEYTINSLKPPVIGGKHSFSFVSLLLRIGISLLEDTVCAFIRNITESSIKTICSVSYLPTYL